MYSARESLDCLVAMQLKLLIDGIVRQTTVLVARLSTGQGVRSPLGRIADQVFLDLARELQQQGVSKVLAADMFGLALRTYQRKTQRLTESASITTRTLWEAIYDFVRTEEVTRARVKERFRNDGEREVAAVLTDLVRSGVLYVTGAGDAAVYGVNDARVRAFAQHSSDSEARVHYAWFKIFHSEVRTREQLMTELACDEAQVDAVLAQLISDGRVNAEDGCLSAVNLLIPQAAEEGMETALLDHYRAVTTVLAERVTRGRDHSELTGGSTFSFRMDRNHPQFEEVSQLFLRTRRNAHALWERAMAYNETHAPSPDAVKITFYAGQSTLDPNVEAPQSISPEQDTLEL